MYNWNVHRNHQATCPGTVKYTTWLFTYGFHGANKCFVGIFVVSVIFYLDMSKLKYGNERPDQWIKYGFASKRSVSHVLWADKLSLLNPGYLLVNTCWNKLPPKGNTQRYHSQDLRAMFALDIENITSPLLVISS